MRRPIEFYALMCTGCAVLLGGLIEGNASAELLLLGGATLLVLALMLVRAIEVHQGQRRNDRRFGDKEER